MYIKMDLALDNLQRLVCHKTHQTKPNQTKPYPGHSFVCVCVGGTLPPAEKQPTKQVYS